MLTIFADDVIASVVYLILAGNAITAFKIYAEISVVCVGPLVSGRTDLRPRQFAGYDIDAGE